METKELDEMTQTLKALSDKMRLQIVGLLAQQSRAVEELATALKLSPATVSHHLNRLKEAGLVTSEREQYYAMYRLDEARLQRIGQRLGGHPQRFAPSTDGADSYDQNVLDRFIVDGKLVSIPRQRKKRDVILRRLASCFEADRAYGEREVNEILGAYHEDVATLRRELIATRLLARSRGEYRRL
jgi:ArsR family transcriptional regulator